MNQEERVISLKDILAECLFKWKLILLAAILGGVAGLGVTVMKTRQYQTELAAQQAERAAQEAAQQEAEAAADAEDADEPSVHNGPYDKQMAEARALLTQLQITKVDGLYAQYAANIQLRDSLSDNINNSLIMQMDADHAVATRLMYTLDTDLDYLGAALGSMITTDDLYEQAAAILGKDVEPRYLSDLISVWKGNTGSTGDSIHIYDGDRMTSVIYLQAIAFTKEQADEITALMAERLEAAIKSMHSADPDIKIKRIGDVSYAMTTSFIDDIQRSLVTELNNVANQIVTIEVNEIPKLDEDEKTYYDLLVSEGKGIHVNEETEAENTVAEPVVEQETLTPPSKTKFVALGLIGGAVLAFGILFLYLFLFSRKARSLEEIESGTGIPTLAVYERRLKGAKDPIVRCGISLQTGGKAVREETAYQPILNVRIQELLQQSGKSHLYLYDEGEPVMGGWSGFAAVSGRPEASSEAMQEFLQADSVILVTRMYETEIAVLSSVIELCRVHDKQILGNIVIYG